MESSKKLWRFLRDVVPLCALICARAADGTEPSLTETLLAVRINGELVSDSTLFLQYDDGSLAARAIDLQSWRLRVPENAEFAISDDQFVLLDALDVEYRIDQARLELAIDASGTKFESTSLGREYERFSPQEGRGAYVNYDVVWNGSDNQASQLTGVVEAVAFNSRNFGVFTNDLLLDHSDTGLKVTRLQSTLTKDLVGSRQTLRFGDAVSRGSVLGSPVRFGGFQWSTNFAVDPTFIFRPTMHLAGLVDQPAVVDVFVNNVLQSTSEIQRGPFELNQIPRLHGDGTVELVVTDILGRQQSIVQPFYASSTNLAKGVTDFSVEAGFERLDYSLEDSTYGDAFVSASYRRGLTDQFTGGMHAELLENLTVVGVSGEFARPRLGHFAAHLIGSSADDQSGTRHGVSYDYSGRRYHAGLGVEYASPYFEQMGRLNETSWARLSKRVRFGAAFGRFGSASISYVSQSFRDTENREVLSMSYNVGLGPGNLRIVAAQTIRPQQQTSLLAQFVVSLGRNNTVVSRLDRTGSQNRQVLEYQQDLGSAEIGVNYRLIAERGESADRYQGNLAWQGTAGRLTADVARVSGANSVRVGASGGVGIVGGQAFVSRRINQSFAMVDVGDLENVTVYIENRVAGKTGKNGQLYIPDLAPYRGNAVSLEPLDIPFEATVTAVESYATPYYRSGAIVQFTIESNRTATVTIVDESGEPVPSGATVIDEQGASAGRVAKDGFTYLTGLNEGEIEFVVESRSVQCRFALQIPADAVVLPNLGEVVCH